MVPTLCGANFLISEQFITTKKSILSKLYPPLLRHSLLGQYIDYQKHLQEDEVLQPLVNDSNSSTSITPTFASVVLYLYDPRWHRVPFILVSGKQLDKRTSYARVVFKQRQFRVGSRSSNHSPCQQEIIFLIQGEQLPSPGVLISEQLSSTRLTYPKMGSVRWTEESTTYPKASDDNNRKYTYIHPSQTVETNAYVSVIRAVLEGEQKHFVDTGSLLLSWEVWSPLLHEIELSKHSLDLRPYSAYMLDGLDFELKGTTILPSSSISTIDTNSKVVSKIGASISSNVSTYWTELLKHRIVVAGKYALSYLVAEDLLRAAQKSVIERGEFQMALPGGQSPLPLMNVLSLIYFHGNKHICGKQMKDV